MTDSPSFYNPRDPKHRNGSWVEVVVTLAVLTISTIAILMAGG